MEKRERVIEIDLRDPDLSEKARKRLSVLLDLNVWIDLAEEKEPRSSELRERLHRLVRKGVLFCPLAPTVIWELYKQSCASAIKVAGLMEELSLGITFAPSEEIYQYEVDAVFEAIRGRTAPRAVSLVELFVPIIAHISSSAQIYFPNASPFEDPQRLAVDLSRQALGIGLVEFVKMTHHRASQLELRVPGYAEAGTRRKEIAGGSREKARRVEEEAVMRSIVTPRLLALFRRLPPYALLEFYRQFVDLPVDRYGGAGRHLIGLMPSVDHRINLLSLVGRDPGRRDHINDFFDLELIMAPYVYSTVLVSRDKGMRYLLKSLGGEYRCLWTYDALEEFLDGLEVHGVLTSLRA